VLVLAGEVLPAAGNRLMAEAGSLALVLLADDGRAVEALRRLPLRGWGIVSPEAGAGELQAAVRAAAQGLVVLPLSLAGRLTGGLPHTPPPVEAPAEPLTARETEVLALLSQGLSNKLIARRLQISEHTVKFHVASIFTKLGAASRTEAVSRGARSGLITL
jgi:DNA-binding NarL/FixJ family response regulator